MKNKLLNQIKAICQEEIDINNNPDTHFSKVTDGTDGICEGRLEFAESLLDFINFEQKWTRVEKNWGITSIRKVRSKNG